MRRRTPARRVWIDIDNPPQVQYLLPLRRAFLERGADVVVTARDHGITHELLRAQGVEFVPVGRHRGRATASKVRGVLARTRDLLWLLRGVSLQAAVFATRAAAVAAFLRRLPGFAMIDYEHVDLRIFRHARSYVLHPALLTQALRAAGIRDERLLPYEGIKEHVTFGWLDVDSVEPWTFEELTGRSAFRVLVRPPDDQSHYYAPASGDLTRALLGRLASMSDVVVIFSPRYSSQTELLAEHAWEEPPVVLTNAVPGPSLLRGVDAVVTAGGTMAREAAFLGVPAYSVFAGSAGAVDRYLEAEGRLVTLRDRADIDALDIRARQRTAPLGRGTSTIASIVETVFERSGRLT